MAELERQLVELGRALDHPPVPDLAGSVAARLADAPGPRRRRLSAPPRRTLVLALLLVLLLAGTVLAAVPAVRDALFDVFRVQGATVERRERAPRARIETPLALGERLSLAAAGERVGFHIVSPAELGPPEEVQVLDGVPGGQVSLTYGPRQGLPRTATTGLGLLVTEFRGDLSPEYAGKIVEQATTVERVQTAAGRGLWVAGAPHFFFYRDAQGQIRENSLRLAANVLLVERGRLLIRLQGAMTKSRALAIAATLTSTRYQRRNRTGAAAVTGPATKGAPMRWSILLLAFLLLVPPALAKEVTSVKVCGPSACRDVSAQSAEAGIVDGGQPSPPPRHAEEWYRVHFVVSDGTEGHPFTIDVLPRAGYVLSRNGEPGRLTWMRLTSSGSRAYRTATRGLEPFPAAELPGIKERATPARPETGGSDSPLMWILEFAAVASAVAGGLWSRTG